MFSFRHRAGLLVLTAAAFAIASSSISAVQASGEASRTASAATASTATPGQSATAVVEAPSQAAATAEKPQQAAPKPVAPTLIARIDLTNQRITVTEHGKSLHTWKISSGRAGYLTPRGTFRPSWASKMWYSRTYDNAPMPYAVFFNDGIATHGTNAVHALGRPASHGCIRLTTANARRLYQLVHRHGYARTRFIVTGTTPAGSSKPAVAARTSKSTATDRRTTATPRLTRVPPPRSTGYRQVSPYHVRSRTYVVGSGQSTYRAPSGRVVRPRRLIFPGDTY